MKNIVSLNNFLVLLKNLNSSASSSRLAVQDHGVVLSLEPVACIRSDGLNSET